MRHYFTEKHKTPISWFQMRLSYSRSIATTSIVGHVLGLGDRHISNILLDNVTGEVVHIDLGIAFDQVGSSSPTSIRTLNDSWRENSSLYRS
jgi:ataxia telangiectasia mutated family protein